MNVIQLVRVSYHRTEARLRAGRATLHRVCQSLTTLSHPSRPLELWLSSLAGYRQKPKATSNHLVRGWVVQIWETAFALDQAGISAAAVHFKG